MRRLAFVLTALAAIATPAIGHDTGGRTIQEWTCGNPDEGIALQKIATKAPMDLIVTFWYRAPMHLNIKVVIDKEAKETVWMNGKKCRGEGKP